MENCRQPATRARSAGPHAPTRLRPLLPAAPRFPPPEPAAAWLAESSRGRRFPPPARGEPRGQDGEGGRGAQRWPEAGGECPQEALAGAGATGRPRTLPRRASRVSRVAARQPPRGGEAAPGTPSSARTHALLPPPYGNLQPPQSDTSKIPRPGRSPSPPLPGQRSCRGDLGGGADSSEQRRPRGGGELRAPASSAFFPPGASGGPEGPPPALPGRAVAGRPGLRSQVFLGHHPERSVARERTRADSVSGPRAPKRRDPRAIVGGTSPPTRQPAAHARLTSP